MTCLLARRTTRTQDKSHLAAVRMQTLDEAVRKCKGKVAVVGNGPLSQQDRNEINASKCIVRFNDMKNMKKGERVTIQATRYKPVARPFCGSDKFDIGAAALLPVAPGPYLPNLNARQRRSINLIQPLPTYEYYDGRHSDLSLFKGCARCEGKQCKYGSTPWGPSTGALVLNALQQLDNVKVIHVYGMNWNGSHNHVDFKNGDIVPTCCTKCIFNKPPSQKYYGEHQFVTDALVADVSSTSQRRES